MATARLAAIDPPDPGMPATRPVVPAWRYARRVAALRERAEARGYDRLVVFADREHIEDGVALADAGLRAEIAAAYPEAWARIGIRRAFMRDSLGIDLHPDVLPLSNLAGHLPPYLLSPGLAMTVAG